MKCLLVFTMVVIISGCVTPEPAERFSTYINISAESMQPWMQIADIAEGVTNPFIADIYLHDLVIVDIYTYDVPVLHRVVHIDREDGIIVTRGDSNLANDPPVRISQVMMLVTEIKRYKLYRFEPQVIYRRPAYPIVTPQ